MQTQKTVEGQGGRRQRGFTLIEMMIVVAVMGILAAVAYPSYIQFITKSNRRAAQSFMLEVSSRQQRYLLDARSYADASVSDPAQANSIPKLLLISPSPDVARNYDITSPVKAGSKPPGFTVEATPKGNQAARDSGCGKLTIDEAGAKSVAGSQGVSACW